MDKKRKSGSGVFFILIPLFIVIAAFIYDNVLMVIAKKNYRLATESIIKDVLSNSYNNKTEMVEKFYQDKKLETEQLNTTYEDNVLYIYNVHTFPSFFGRVLGVKSYRTEVDLKCYKNENNEIIIEEVEEG